MAVKIEHKSLMKVFKKIKLESLEPYILRINIFYNSSVNDFVLNFLSDKQPTGIFGETAQNAYASTQNSHFSTNYTTFSKLCIPEKVKDGFIYILIFSTNQTAGQWFL